jgi:hypothetical protein
MPGRQCSHDALCSYSPVNKADKVLPARFRGLPNSSLRKATPGLLWTLYLHARRVTLLVSPDRSPEIVKFQPVEMLPDRFIASSLLKSTPSDQAQRPESFNPVEVFDVMQHMFAVFISLPATSVVCIL